ncbi:HNH endonuclease [Lederbergia lenta]|uniref:Putative HNH nuclease YajD n=1 Tax=Lederbergia lenta TaxID=1467 RepID=A0A2X4W1U7_LEDLE|nr:HNH endonuclease [Lederbergia lenta]MCM3109371.1 HNH endonuclease [Lederbergia lenta]MEC2324864.1 HNH endonuclease [Lederbergia lenta]SQI57033.1 HNH endonuclease domain-containing protein [Lederbergia lenta]
MTYNKNYIRKKFPFDCKFCGITFHAYKKGKATQKYCSQKCSNEAQKNGKEYLCEICKAIVIRTPGNIKKKIYCSKKCADIGKIGVPVNTTEKVKFTCIICKKTENLLPCYAKAKVVCSRNCAATLLSQRGTISVACTNCNSMIIRNKSRVRGKLNFCCDECMITHFRESDFMKGENNPNFLGGTIKYYGPDWHNQRRLARKRDLYTCQDCGITEIERDKELDVHHKIPFRFFEYSNDANNLNNLISLCSDCHRKCHTGELNPSRYDKTKIKIPFGSKGKTKYR